MRRKTPVDKAPCPACNAPALVTKWRNAAHSSAQHAQGISAQSTSAVHDRRAQELPAHAMVAPVEIDDPYEPGANIIALQSLRDWPLNYMRARGQIDGEGGAVSRLVTPAVDN